MLFAFAHRNYILITNHLDGDVQSFLNAGQLADGAATLRQVWTPATSAADDGTCLAQDGAQVINRVQRGGKDQMSLVTCQPQQGHTPVLLGHLERQALAVFQLSILQDTTGQHELAQRPGMGGH